MVLKSRTLAPDWSADGDPDREALCRKFALPDDHDVSKDPWFHDMEEAAHICNGDYSGRICPLRDPCLTRALINNEGYGCFGGMLPIQRRWIRRNKDTIPWDTWLFPERFRRIVPSVDTLIAEEEANESEDYEDDGQD